MSELTSHEISWAVWVSCLLTTSAINTWHGTRRLFAMRLNVEAATGRISNSSSEALSKKQSPKQAGIYGASEPHLCSKQISWAVWELESRVSLDQAVKHESSWCIFMYTCLCACLCSYIYILLFWHGETGTETTSGWWKRRIAAATRHATSGGGGQIFMDPTPKSCAIAHTNAAEAKACVYACIFQDKHAHIYIYTSQPWASYLPSGCHSLLRELAMTLGIGFLRSRRRPMNPPEAVEMQTKRPGICTWHAMFACVQLYV